MNTYEYGTSDLEAIMYFMGSGDDTVSDDENVTDIYGTDTEPSGETDGEFNPEDMTGGQGGFGGGRPGHGGHRPDMQGEADAEVTEADADTDTDNI